MADGLAHLTNLNCLAILVAAVVLMMIISAVASLGEDADDIILGDVVDGGGATWRMTRAIQACHTLVLGRTGSGKSKLVENIVRQRVQRGNGTILIDPHGDSARSVLAQLVEVGYFEQPDAVERLRYVHFGPDTVVPFNVLQVGYGSPEDRANDILDAFARVWPEIADQAHFSALFPAAVLTLIANDLPLVALVDLLRDEEFRYRCLSRVENHTAQEMMSGLKAGDVGLGGSAGAMLRRIIQMCFNPASSLPLAQKDNVLDFRRIMDARGSVIIDLGDVQSDVTRRLLAALCLVGIERAAMSRIDLKPEARVPSLVVVDEWFAIAPSQGRTIENVLSQTRKYGVALVLCGQHLGQAGSAGISGALDNIRLTVAMGLGRQSAEIVARDIARLDTDLRKVDPRTQEDLGPMPLSQRTEVWTQRLMQMRPQDAVVMAEGEKPVRIKTKTITEPEAAKIGDRLRAVQHEYLQRYHLSRDQAEANYRQLVAQVTGSVPSNIVPFPGWPVEADEPIFGERAAAGQRAEGR